MGVTNDWLSGIARELGKPAHDWQRTDEQPRLGPDDEALVRYQCKGCKNWVLWPDDGGDPGGFCGLPAMGQTWRVGGRTGDVVKMDLGEKSFVICDSERPGVLHTFMFGQGEAV